MSHAVPNKWIGYVNIPQTVDIYIEVNTTTKN